MFAPIRPRTYEDALQDQVTAALETGNAAQARLVVAENIEHYPDAVERIRSAALADYGIRI